MPLYYRIYGAVEDGVVSSTEYSNLVSGAVDTSGVTLKSNFDFSESRYYQSFLKFDISAIPTGGSIASATLHLYRLQGHIGNTTGAQSPGLVVYGYNWAEPLTTAAWRTSGQRQALGGLGRGFNGLSDRIDGTGWQSSDPGIPKYDNISLSSTAGLSYIGGSVSTVKLLIGAHWSGTYTNGQAFSSADESGTAQDPYLDLAIVFEEQLVTATGGGSWVVPSGVTEVQVECWGAGGGGSVASGQEAGGRGGDYARKTISVVASDTIFYSVPAGSAPGATSAACWARKNTNSGPTGADVVALSGGQTTGVSSGTLTGDVTFSGGAGAAAQGGGGSRGGSGGGGSASAYSGGGDGSSVNITPGTAAASAAGRHGGASGVGASGGSGGASSVAGTAGTADIEGGGGGGGGGSGAAGANGGAPGGGAGGGGNSGNAGTGGRGQVRISWRVPPSGSAQAPRSMHQFRQRRAA